MQVEPWGKLCGKERHHLAHHCADVAACFEALLRLPAIRSAFERAAGRPLFSVDIARLAMIAFLHDAGKLHPGFQAAGWPQVKGKGLRKHGHSGEGQAIFFETELQELRDALLRIEEIAGWGAEETLAGLLKAGFAHHGRPLCVENRHCQRWNDVPEGIAYDAFKAAKDIGDCLPVWFRAAFDRNAGQLPDNPDFQHLFAGLVTLADWLGSDSSRFAFVADFDPNHMKRAREIATCRMTEIGLDVTQLRKAMPSCPGFEHILPGRLPRPAQAAVGAFDLEDPLVILEAETGSGKTEAALWRFARLFSAGKVDALYFAAPTRAAAVQLHRRVDQAMKALFGKDGPETVLAVPGYFRAGDHEGRALPGFEVLWDDQGSAESTARRWSAENAKRFLAATIAVGTVDQVMLAALQVKHAHLRGAALARSLLVVDEVHASDTYMSKVQEKLLETHLGRGGHAMLMSATLGACARATWLGQRASAPDREAAIGAPYPAVWGQASGLVCVQPEGQEKRVHMRLENGWEAGHAARLAIDVAERGARVLVIRNTVTAAVETFHAVCKAGAAEMLLTVAGKPTLHHSRFAAEDRRQLDKQVETVLSPDNAKRTPGGMIIIGTQTVEQSLDICADFLVTDLCPADVLLQRLGRLHRHRDLVRPAGFKEPCCKVLSPANGLDRLAKPDFENGLGLFERDGGGIYTNLHAAELTRRLVAEQPQWVIPDMNRMIVESAVHPDAIAALSDEKGAPWKDYEDTVLGAAMAERGQADMAVLDMSRCFGEEMFADAEESIRTRLGAEGSRIEFVPGTKGPFGTEITAITCPAHWKGIVAEDKVATETADGGELQFAVEDTAFAYSTCGLVKL